MEPAEFREKSGNFGGFWEKTLGFGVLLACCSEVGSGSGGTFPVFLQTGNESWEFPKFGVFKENPSISLGFVGIKLELQEIKRD